MDESGNGHAQMDLFGQVDPSGSIAEEPVLLRGEGQNGDGQNGDELLGREILREERELRGKEEGSLLEDERRNGDAMRAGPPVSG